MKFYTIEELETLLETPAHELATILWRDGARPDASGRYSLASIEAGMVALLEHAQREAEQAARRLEIIQEIHGENEPLD